jgi:hypothetical protein
MVARGGRLPAGVGGEKIVETFEILPWHAQFIQKIDECNQQPAENFRFGKPASKSSYRPTGVIAP